MFELYHEGVVVRTRVRGKKRYLLERAFLDALVGLNRPPDSRPEPRPEFYPLNDEQMDAYFAFRRQQSRAERGFSD